MLTWKLRCTRMPPSTEQFIICMNAVKRKWRPINDKSHIPLVRRPIYNHHPCGMRRRTTITTLVA